MGWVNWDSNNSSVETPEKCGDELQPWRINQERPFAICPQALEPGTYSPRSPVQICIAQLHFFCFSILQERIGQLVGLVERSPAQDFNQGGMYRRRPGKRGDHPKPQV